MNSKNTHVDPTTKFDWSLYSDGTFAGLSVLIPIPLLDLLFETIFFRRMIHTIAKRNGRELSPEIMGIINQRQGCFPGCFLWPVTLGLEFVKRLYRTVLYFLTIKSATDQLSYYWHRAFLLDYMLRRGDLDNAAKAKIASAALQTLLKTTTTSPLFQLANKISAGVNHIFRTLWQFLRRHREDEVVVNTRKEMEESWGKFSDYLIELAARYDILFTEIEQTQIGEMIHDQS